MTDDGISEIFAKWRRHDHMQLHAGEMTAQEKRSVVAVLNAVEAEVAAAVPLAVERERERAARVALNYPFTDDAQAHSNHAVMCNAAQNIAAAIRSGNGGE